MECYNAEQVLVGGWPGFVQTINGGGKRVKSPRLPPPVCFVFGLPWGTALPDLAADGGVPCHFLRQVEPAAELFGTLFEASVPEAAGHVFFDVISGRGITSAPVRSFSS